MTDRVTRLYRVILFCQKIKLKCYTDERIVLLLLPRDAMLARYYHRKDCLSVRLFVTLVECKGVRCPPIFSLSNLINAGWLVRKCVNIYTSFNCCTNRKAYLLHASFALKDSHCQWSSIINFTEVQQLMPERLHTYEYHNGHQLETILTNEDKERLVTWPCWDIDDTVELVETTIRW